MADIAETRSLPLAMAAVLLVFYAVLYVLPFYASSVTRPSMLRSRDDPLLIRGRIRAVSLSCIVCSVSTCAIHYFLSAGTLTKTVHSMGYMPIGVYETFRSLLLTAILFLGPLYEAGIVEGRWRDWISGEKAIKVLQSWTGWRNLVVGPITEEVLFRSASVPLLLLSPASSSMIIFLTPIVFGLSHVHHFYECRVSDPDASLFIAILQSCVQFSYTSLFGGYATFIFLRTGSLLSVVVIHSFCNWMGLPRLWGKVGERDSGPRVGHYRKIDNVKVVPLGIVWSAAYYVLLFGGAVAWFILIWPLTESRSALTKL